MHEEKQQNINGVKIGAFEVKKSDDGLMFDLKASNGAIIGMSEVYNTRDSQGHCRDDCEQ